MHFKIPHCGGDIAAAEGMLKARTLSEIHGQYKQTRGRQGLIVELAGATVIQIPSAAMHFDHGR